MKSIPSLFDERKALEVVLFIAGRLKKPALHNTFKMLYFADKLHLQKYGRFILHDEYVAMKHGPVPSHLYDFLKIIRHPDKKTSYKKSLEIKNLREIVPHRKPQLDLLSDSEQECLQEIVDQYGTKSFAALTDLSHDSAWNNTNKNDRISIEAIAATLPNASILAGYLKDPY